MRVVHREPVYYSGIRAAARNASLLARKFQPVTVHQRKMYVDCRFGQLHVHTAFPSSGGFDELTPLVGVFGYLKPYKRIPESLRAFRRLARLVPDVKMILTGEAIDAQEAHRIGLANMVVPPADLMATAERIARTIMTKGPKAIANQSRLLPRSCFSKNARE